MSVIVSVGGVGAAQAPWCPFEWMNVPAGMSVFYQLVALAFGATIEWRDLLPIPPTVTCLTCTSCPMAGLPSTATYCRSCIEQQLFCQRLRLDGWRSVEMTT
jgi:hypothetical protein